MVGELHQFLCTSIVGLRMVQSGENKVYFLHFEALF